MKTTTGYTFELSLTDKAYDHKPTDSEIKILHFTKKTIGIDDFIFYMLNGHGYTGVYSYDSFVMTQKNKDNFRYSYLVTIDVDHSHETMEELVERFAFKPTCAYTSCNNGQDGEYKFRLVYCFDEKIGSREQYYNLVYTILIANGVDIEREVAYKNKKYDQKSEDAIQYFNGNGTGNIEFIINDILYNINDFNSYYKEYKILYNTNKKSIIKNYINKQQPHNNIHLNDTFEDKQFEEDYWKMKDEDILSKYVSVYPNLEHTPLPIVDDDTPYIIYPSDYIEIRRICKVGKEGKYIRVNDSNPLKIKDGQGRRRTLFWNGIIRRLINPNITFDNLIYNLLFELCHYITNYNANNVIGKKEVYQIAIDVMRQDMTKHEHLRGTGKQFLVNPNYCIKYNLTKNEVKSTAAKMIRFNKIGEIYDCSQTDKKNIEIMKENGLKVSLSTLKRWRKENGITKYKI